jgi:hypothetical protein
MNGPVLTSWGDLNVRSDLTQFQLCWEKMGPGRTIWCRGAIESLLFRPSDGNKDVQVVEVKFAWKAMFHPVLNIWVAWNEHFHGEHPVVCKLPAEVFAACPGGEYRVKGEEWLHPISLIPPGIGKELRREDLYQKPEEIYWDYLSKKS